MDNRFKKIDKLFQDSLNHWQEMPPIHVWDEIEYALHHASADTNTNPSFKKRYAIAALLLVAAVGSTMLWPHKTQQQATRMAAVHQTILQNNSPVRTFSNIQHNTGAIAGSNEINIQQEITYNNNGPAILSQGYSQTTADTGANDALLSFPQRQRGVVFSTEHEPFNTNPYVSMPMGGQPLLSADATTTVDDVPLQHLSVAKKMLKKFSLTVFFAPDLNTRALEQTGTALQGENKSEIMRTEKNNAFDFTIGAKIDYKLSDHFSLQSGISFSSNTIDISPKTIYARYDVDGTVKYRFNFSSGYAFFKPKTAVVLADGDSTQTLSSTSLLHYVNIPLALKYNYAIGRFNFFAQAGITARFITKQSIAAVYASNGAHENNSTNSIQDLKTSYFNGVLGVGADYALSKKLAVSVFPSFNFATSSINKTAPVKAYPNTFSIASGLRFSF